MVLSFSVPLSFFLKGDSEMFNPYLKMVLTEFSKRVKKYPMNEGYEREGNKFLLSEGNYFYVKKIVFLSINCNSYSPLIVIDIHTIV